MQSSFEAIVKELGLSPNEYRDSVPLKNWVLENMDTKYVPWDLLKAWGLVEDDRDSETAA